MSQLPDLICPRNSVTKYPLFLRNTLTPVPRNNVARYNLKTGGFDPPSNRALLTCRDFALKEPTQVVEMAPVVGGAFDSQGLAVFFDTSQLEVIKVLIEQEVDRVFSHGWAQWGWYLSLRRRRGRAARVRPRSDLYSW